MIGAAIKVARIATGEIVKDTKPNDGKDKVEALHTPVLRSQTRSLP